MNLEQLEWAAHALSVNQELGLEVLEAQARTSDAARGILCLARDGQLHVVLALRRVEKRLLDALEGLTPDTEYLRDELETQVESTRILLGKVEVEEALRKDREAVLSAFHQEADQPGGVLEWIGKQGPDSGSVLSGQ